MLPGFVLFVIFQSYCLEGYKEYAGQVGMRVRLWTSNPTKAGSIPGEFN